MPGEAGSGTGERARAVGWALLGSEIGLLLRRRRTWAMLAALAAIPVLMALVVFFSADPPAAGEGPPLLDKVTQNGMFVSVTALVVTTPLFLPLTISVVAGDTIAGEAGLGTLRYLLVAPAGRLRLLLVKYAGAAVFALLTPAVVLVAGWAIGAGLFGVGEATLLSGDPIGPGGALVRSALVAGYVAVSMLGLSAIGLFISTLTTAGIGAMASTAVLAVVAQVLGQLQQLDWLHPWLFTHHWLGMLDLLREPISWSSLADNAVLQAGYVAFFGALAYGRFTTKDVLS
ncbi:MAG TPA: ABC transporter permease [Candidatus Ruania gallistercoris]|uniref:ABC transporter permease n=1 Tax=Candidatus Ruania gallistercoris TaxID=2838746 RepID=A0A9D2EIC8_9MICO|nr:ABC transporter permease [Candidatus Ruania gallistercoris]